MKYKRMYRGTADHKQVLSICQERIHVDEISVVYM